MDYPGVPHSTPKKPSSVGSEPDENVRILKLFCGSWSHMGSVLLVPD